MRFWSWFIESYEGKELLITILAVAAGILVITAMLAYFLRTSAVFCASWAIVAGGAQILISYLAVEKNASSLGMALLFLFGGTVYLLLFLLLSIRAYLLKRKQLRAEIARKLCYTLPDRENSYVRARLNTALYVPEKELNATMGATDAKKLIKLSYAKQLLNKLHEAPLTQAERLQREEMNKAFLLYLDKEAWSAEDLRAVNELCAALLKLSAKYAV